MALELLAVSRRHGPTVVAHELTLRLEQGQIGVLLGRSGSGKTSLLRMVAGLDRPDQGAIVCEGVCWDDGRAWVPPEQRGLGVVFQQHALWPHLDALGNVGLALRNRRSRGWREQARAALRQVGLADAAERYPHELSGGQQQRVALARALALRPALLLFDEPLASLDAALRDSLRYLIQETVRECGATALYITHDRAEGLFLADRLGVLGHGRLLQWDRPAAVHAAPASPGVADLMGYAGPYPALLRPDALVWAGHAWPRPRWLKYGPGPILLYLAPDALALAPGPSAGPELLGRVRACGYVGGSYEALLDVGGEPSRISLPQRAEPGELLPLTLDLGRTQIFMVAAEGAVDSSVVLDQESALC